MTSLNKTNGEVLPYYQPQAKYFVFSSLKECSII